MFHTTLTVALSAPPAPSSRVRRLLKELFGAQPPVEHETLKLRLAKAERVLIALRDAGFGDVLSVSIGTHHVYDDEGENEDDIELALTALAEYEVPKAPGKTRLVVSRVHDGLHTLALVHIDDSRDPAVDISIQWSSRVLELRVASGEGPADYRDRVRGAIGRGAFAEKFSAAKTAAEALEHALGTTFPEARVSAAPLAARVVVPAPAQVGRFRNLGFGARIRKRTYTAQPGPKRKGAYDDPHVYHFFDPYHDLLAWILVQEANTGAWDADGVDFVDVAGKRLFTGSPTPPAVLAVPASAVTFLPARLEIADEIPSMGFDVAEAGSPDTPGWGGGNIGG